jgi:hypothetical protein
MTPEDYRLAAASELVAEGGSTRPPPAAQEWLAPFGVREADDGIEWLPRESLIRDGMIVPSEGLLEDFVRLRDADVGGVAAFAQVHGVLGCGPARWYQPGKYAFEPLAEWHAAARRADALITAAQRLRDRKPLNDDMRVPVLKAAWPDVEARLRGDPIASPADSEGGVRAELLLLAGRNLEDDRVQLAWAVTTWMQQVGAQLVLHWPAGAGEPVLAIGGERARGCLQAVTVQVALACARAEATRACDGCGALHAPRRSPKPGDRSFCQACRDAKVPLKIAKRESRSRQREAEKKGSNDG